MTPSEISEDQEIGSNLDGPLNSVRHKCRLLLLLNAMERVGITPIPMKKLHAFAYLADVLSPVWGFIPYDGKIYKMESGPHYSELARELDELVMLGLVTILNLRYIGADDDGAWIDGEYQLRFESDDLLPIIAQLGGEGALDALDPRDVENHAYLVELASALATLPQDEIDLAAQVDATYSNSSFSFRNVIEFSTRTKNSAINPSLNITKRFKDFMPDKTHLSPGERVYLYASYLGQKLSA